MNENPDISRDWFPGKSILGAFVIERILGEGGMGTVFLVRRIADGHFFAVKTLLRNMMDDPMHKQLFIRELQTWIDLPEHPHLTACRFFRTVDDRIAIFAEYVDGGSLADWIRDRKSRCLETILSIAIQMAWGLDAAHQFGLIHRDVKPHNVLLTRDSLVKITDFGLSRLRTKQGKPISSQNQTSNAGMTVAYCSPEQAEGHPLTLKTDIWSFAVSVLEMFTGEVKWQFGFLAPHFLSRISEIELQPDLLEIPDPVKAVLTRCFALDPSDRWNSMDDIATTLMTILTEITGRSYDREKPNRVMPGLRADYSLDRKTITGGAWDNPEIWLRRALRMAGDDESRADAVSGNGSGSRKAQALADLALYEEVEQIYSRLEKDGTRISPDILPLVLHNKASLQEAMDDYPGVIATLTEAINRVRNLMLDQPESEFKSLLACSYANMANAYKILGKPLKSIELYNLAIVVFEDIDSRESSDVSQSNIARSNLNKAIALISLHQYKKAINILDNVIPIRETLQAKNQTMGCAKQLIRAYLTKAVALNAVDKPLHALKIFDRATAVVKSIATPHNSASLELESARIFQQKAMTVKLLGNYDEALALNLKAIHIIESLVSDQRKSDNTDILTVLYTNHANTHRSIGNRSEAIRWYEKAITLFHQLVLKEGHTELENYMAKAMTNKGLLLFEMNRLTDADQILRDAASILERWMEEGHTEFTSDLVRTYTGLTDVQIALNKAKTAELFFEKILGLLRRALNSENQAKLSSLYVKTLRRKALFLIKANRSEEALKPLDEIFAILTQTDRIQYVEEPGEQAAACLLKAGVLNAAGQRNEAEKLAAPAFKKLKSALQRTGTTDLDRVWTWARKTLGPDVTDNANR
jgi:tetratricopeptide (TPR) repeat protein